MQNSRRLAHLGPRRELVVEQGEQVPLAGEGLERDGEVALARDRLLRRLRIPAHLPNGWTKTLELEHAPTEYEVILQLSK